MNKNAMEQQTLLSNVNQLAGKRQLNEALALAETIQQKHPKFAEAWLVSAFLYFQTNQIDRARCAIKQARELEPNNKTYAFQEFMMLQNINKTGEALSVAKQLAYTPFEDNKINETLARFLEINFAFKEAKLMYSHLHEKQPNFSDWLAKLASIEQVFGNIDAAEQLTQQALDKKPNHANVYFFMSNLKKQTSENNHINKLKSLIAQNQGNSTNQAMLHFALAKELEDCKLYPESFKYRKTGADIYRSTFKYDVTTDVTFMQQIQKEYDADFLKSINSKPSDDKPVFIVGLPRSGTTLVDRIISAHSNVTAADELGYFNQGVLFELNSQNISKHISQIGMVKASKLIEFNKLGQDYLENAQHAKGTTSHFTDKFPQNSYYVGMILKALPNARIIIMQRNPVAVCYSVYKQMFNNNSYPFSYDLKEMAAYYNQHNELLNHWQNIGGDSVKTVYYEDLVNDLEPQAKDIMTFLNLDWQPQCLDFHKNKQATSTASASQVREKLYTDSIDMWRNYEEQLAPLIEALNVDEKFKTR